MKSAPWICLAGRSSARRSEIPTLQLQSRAERASKQMKQLSSRLISTWATVKSKRRSTFNFNFQQQLAHLQTALASNTGNWAATKKSLAVLYNILQQQSSLLSYVYGFRFCVLICLVCAALAFLFKKVGKPTGPVAAH